MRVALLCRRGEAGNDGYGTLVENLDGAWCSPDVSYTVVDRWRDLLWKRMSYDAVVVSMASSCFWLPLFGKSHDAKVIVHVDRVAYSGRNFLKRFLALSAEKRVARSADVVVATNRSVCDHYHEVYGIQPKVIGYGGEHLFREVSKERESEILTEYGLRTGEYAFAMSRIPSGSNCRVVLEAFSKSMDVLAFSGDWTGNDCSRKLRRDFARFPNIVHVPYVGNDPEVLYVLLKNSFLFVDGHEEKDPGPLFVSAMALGKPIVCRDTRGNRMMTRDLAIYFNDSQDILHSLLVGKFKGEPMGIIARSLYNWKYINRQYEALYEK